VPRRKSIRERKGRIEKKHKSPYQKRDSKILRVATYLITKGDEGASIGNIISVKADIGLSSQDQTLFTEEIMKLMKKDGWVKERKYSARFKVYVITEKGSSAVQDALKLRQDGSLLCRLEAFQGLVR